MLRLGVFGVKFFLIVVFSFILVKGRVLFLLEVVFIVYL